MNNLDEIRASGLAKYFYKLAEQSQDVFWIKSKDYKQQIYISPAFEDSWGFTCQDLYDDPSLWISVMYEEDRIRLQNDCINRTSPPCAGEIIEKNYRIVRPDNSMRWIKDTSFGLYDDNNECFAFAGICKDVSKDVLHSQELEEAKQNAEMANQAKADFLAKMSHEFRTPLNAIMGMTQIMMRKGLSPEYEEYVSLIAQAGNSLLAFVNDILDFAKVEIGELSFTSEPVDLHLLSSQVIHSFKYQAEEKNIDLTLDYLPEIPKLVMGDAKRIRQIIVNLLNNALKFTEQGSILMKVDYQTNQEGKAFFHVVVKDSGICIEKGKHGYIFEKFSQIESIHQRKQQGTGLGLAITKQLVERIGGNITVESEPGIGSAFNFTLPLPLQDASQVRPVNAQDSIFGCKMLNEKLNMSILLVEDNLINQRVVKLMLDGVGCQLDIANDGQEALRLLKNNKQYDTILMDIGLPDMDGFEVTAKIRENPAYKNIPIIAMTAHALECDIRKCYATGMSNIIIKPIRYEELFELLKRNKHDMVA